MEARTRALDPRSIATRQSLIDRAERLFAEHGIDGVSVRQIGIAIGSANPNVVNYHFGGKTALVQAIIQHRLPAIEARRQALLDRMDALDGQASPGALVDALFRPFLEQVDEEGQHSYIAFLWGLYRSGQMALRVAIGATYPATDALVAAIRSAIPAMAAEDFERRLSIATGMIAAALSNIDHQLCGSQEAERRFADALAMVEAALRAPMLQT